ncbi:DDI1 homolog 2 [Olea europaea subsp. europaea]|uniref:DDI1 homolog 2 n=1 Tax=Olea europaea subsp. europaea TaxID=158383 RepID=A0A8S0RFK5_OLEEU|nr:DDI1 homolog 2 [Olea europaea subsp. europaea]
MKLTVTYDDNVVQLDVYEDMELENLIAYCEAEMGTSFSQLQLLHNARPLEDMKKSLKQYSIVDGDMVLVVNKAVLQQTQQHPAVTAGRQPGQTTSSSSGGGASGASGSSLGGPGLSPQQAEELLSMTEVTMEQAIKVRDSFLKNPDEMTNLKLSNMPLADALATGTLEDFHKILNDQHKRRRDEQLRRFRMMTADPFDVEAQKMIAQEIQRQQIDSNMHDAIEHMPEAFGQVHMLYIKCKVNGTPIDAFVDSGAQSTIMSQACAERCNVTRLIDERWSGIAQGVGTQKILGRIHICQVQIENDFLASSFNVLEHQPMDMLLGLDMLKRHQCVLDLKNNILRIGTTGTETRFLNESELPAHARSNH